MADKPNITTTLASLRKEIIKPEVFKLGLSGGKVITFPDLYDMESMEAEKVFGSLNRNMTNWTAIRQWLSEADADKLAAEKLTVRELTTVMQAAVAHYEDRYDTPGEADASRELIGSYRSEIRADLLSEYGVDLARWYAEGRWVGLLDLIDQLPGASRFYEAVSNDPDQAKILAEHRLTSTDKPDWTPRVSEFTLTAQLLQMLVNEVKSLRRVTIASGGGKPGQEKPVPAPRTAVDEAFERLEDALSGELLSQFGFGPEDF